MHPAKVVRANVTQLTDLPNVGPATVGDLQQLGVRTPDELIGRDPMLLFEQLCRVTGHRHDPCVIDVFMSITAFMNGEPPQPWWAFTDKRKRLVADRG